MLNKITIYQRINSRGKRTAENFTTKYEIEQGDINMLAKAVEFDNCLAEYKNGYKKSENFVKADCILVDLDNVHSDEPTEWITHEDVICALPNVEFYYYPSRNNMKQKGTATPRPKEHYIFPTDVLNSVEEYKNTMRCLIECFPQLHFDQAVKGGAQLNFGVENPTVQYHQGTQNLSEFIKTLSVPVSNSKQQYQGTNIIPNGQRNNHMFKYACRILTRYGDNEETYRHYQQESEKCSPLLDEKELNEIWQNAMKYHHSQTQTAPSYMKQAEYRVNEFQDLLYKPSEFTDLGQAKVFSELYKKKVRYSEATKFLVYDEKIWEESDLKAQRLAQNLTCYQCDEAWELLQNANQLENDAMNRKNDEDIEKAKKRIAIAKQYRKFAHTRQDTVKISATLKEARPMLEIDTALLDKDWYKLNTPNGTVDLRTKELKPHNSADYCTKITNKGPSTEGRELFLDFLDVITCGDKELEEYLQCVAGMIAVGQVYCEHLLIAYGCGRNGKSTFFNLLSRVLGSYSGSLSSEVLTSACYKNKSPEYAELRGKRLVIAAELEDEMQLNTAIVKKLCSTDPIQAEKKYKAPFQYVPSHTLVLYTNHLPKVTALDDGTWRRLVVIPFNAKIQDKEEKKNYAEYLFENAGEFVMQWIVDGAYKFISDDCKLKIPEAVDEENKRYRAENDWITNYITERCDIVSGYQQASGELFKDYQEYCKENGEHSKSVGTFKKALLEKGFKDYRTNHGRYIIGLQLHTKTSDYAIPISADLIKPVPTDFDVTASDSKIEETTEVVF